MLVVGPGLIWPQQGNLATLNQASLVNPLGGGWQVIGNSGNVVPILGGLSLVYGAKMDEPRGRADGF